MSLSSKVVATVLAVAAMVSSASQGAVANVLPSASGQSSAYSYPVGVRLLGSLFTKVTGVGSGKSLVVYGVAKTQLGVVAGKRLKISVRAAKGVSRVEVSTKTDKNGKFSYSIRELARVPGVYFLTVSYGNNAVTRVVNVKKSK